MTESVKTVVINNSELTTRVAPITALRTAWKTTLLQGLSFAASVLLLILGYLQTLNIQTLVTPTQALLWIAFLNITQLVLRAYGVKPIVLDPPKAIIVKEDNVA